ncbi:MAG TPA: hypothetical protein VH597_01825 [Verrucomicrobiae bacterium]|jgi:hypothetical protein|nr:hypothetical protein [Verrucomicrobiae bacterium]
MRIKWLQGYKLLSFCAGLIVTMSRCLADTNSLPLEDFFNPGHSASESTNTPPQLELKTPRHRAPLGESTDLSLEFRGNFKGLYGHYELWVDGEKYPENGPRFVNTHGRFNWIPTQTGTNSLVAKVVCTNGQIIASSPVLINVLPLKHPVLNWLEGPPTHLLPTDKFELRLAATNTDGELANISIYNEDAFQTFSTNKAVLDVHQAPLPPGRYLCSVAAIDDDLMVTRFEFTCEVECLERTDLSTPSKLTVEASDDALLRWAVPANAHQIMSTLIERKSTASNSWDVVGIVPSPATEWHDVRLRTDTAFTYRIAFLSDDYRRSPFTAESTAITRRYDRRSAAPAKIPPPK